MANNLSAKELEKEVEKELVNLRTLLVPFYLKNDIEKIQNEHLQRENAKKATKELDFIFEEIRAEDAEQVQRIEEIMTEAAKLSLPQLKALNQNLQDLTVQDGKDLVRHSKNQLTVLVDLAAIRAFLNNSVVQQQMNQLMQLAQNIADTPCQEAESVLVESTVKHKQKFMTNMSEFLSEQKTGIETVMKHYQQFHSHADAPSPSFRQNDPEVLPELHKLITLLGLFGQLKIQHPTYLLNSPVLVFNGWESLLQRNGPENDIQLKL